MAKKLTVKEYAALRGISPASVRNAIKRKNAMPGVTSKEKRGRDWELTVNVKNVCSG